MLKSQAPRADTNLGQEIDLGSWTVTEELVREYTLAVGDSLPLYFQRRSAPPLAVSAWALGRLLNNLDLPPGAIHSVQEISSTRAVRFGETAHARVQMSKPRHRGGLEFITAAVSIDAYNADRPENQDAAGPGPQNPAISGKTTVLVVGPGGAGQEPGPAAKNDERPSRDLHHPDEGAGPVETPRFQRLERTVTQSRLHAYAQASGDFNPLHLDPEFAAATRFGGIIAHGMLALALISESMAAAFGMDWLSTGALRVRFKGAAYLGDRIATRCRVIDEGAPEAGNRMKCAVQVIESGTGRELITGDASVWVASQAPPGAGAA